MEIGDRVYVDSGTYMGFYGTIEAKSKMTYRVSLETAGGARDVRLPGYRLKVVAAAGGEEG